MKNKLPEIRKKFDISQEKLAEQLNVSRQTIISIEKEKYDPSLPLAFKIAHFFSLKIEDIFLNEEKKENV